MFNQDFSEFIESLNKNEVRYLIVCKIIPFLKQPFK
jgi:hypothetical protein